MSTDNFGMPAVEPEVVEKRRGWWSRNWLWFVPTVFLVSAILCCGCIGGFFFFGLNKLIGLEFCQMGLEKIEANQQVREELGSPITVVTWPPPTIIANITNDQGEGDLRGEIEGPKGRAKVHIQSRLTDGKWGLVVLDIWLPSGEKLSLADEIQDGEDAPPFEANPPGETAVPKGPPPMIDMPTFDAPPPNVE